MDDTGDRAGPPTPLTTKHYAGREAAVLPSTGRASAREEKVREPTRRTEAHTASRFQHTGHGDFMQSCSVFVPVFCTTSTFRSNYCSCGQGPSTVCYSQADGSREASSGTPEGRSPIATICPSSGQRNGLSTSVTTTFVLSGIVRPRARTET